MDEHQVVALEMAVRLRPVPPVGGVARAARDDGFVRNLEYAKRVTRDWPSWTKYVFGWSSAPASSGDAGRDAGEMVEDGGRRGATG